MRLSGGTAGVPAGTGEKSSQEPLFHPRIKAIEPTAKDKTKSKTQAKTGKKSLNFEVCK